MIEKKVGADNVNTNTLGSPTIINNLSSLQNYSGSYGAGIPLTLARHLERFAGDPNYEVLWNSWRIEKVEYAKRLQTVTRIFDNYTTHDEEHSIKIIENIEILLGEDRIALLSPTDTWLILLCAYSHDIGMCADGSEPGVIEKLIINNASEVTNTRDYRKFVEALLEDDELTKLFRKTMEGTFYPYSKETDIFKKAINFWTKRYEDERGNKSFFEGVFTSGKYSKALSYFNLILANYFRKHHAERSCEILKNEAEDRLYCNKLPRRLRLFIADIAYCHGADWDSIYNRLPIEDDGIYRDKVHPRFIASLLRLGDLLDVDSNRYNPFVLSALPSLDEISLAHLLKHHSVSEFCVSPKEIRIVARYNKSDVKRFVKRYLDKTNKKGKKSDDDEFISKLTLNSMRLMREWMTWIENDLREISMSWNNIVPDRFPGAIALKDKLDIYQDGNIVDEEDLELTYKISSSRAAHIVEGSELYKSPFVFIREITQNAVDATLLQLFRDLRQTFSKIKDFKSIPFKEFYTTYIVPINQLCICCDFKIAGGVVNKSLQVNEDSENKSLEVIISDYGIGITRKKLNKMKHIGDINDEELRIEIEAMPEWAQPTGNFGIGMQSIFLTTDSFIINTRPYTAEGEYYFSRKVRFESTRRGGDIIVCEEKASIHSNGIINDINEETAIISHNGTEIVIDVGFSNMFFWNWVFSRRISSREETDISIFSNATTSLQSLLCDYIRETFTEAIIPLEFKVALGDDTEIIKINPIFLYESKYSDVNCKLRHFSETYFSNKLNTRYSVPQKDDKSNSFILVTEKDDKNNIKNCITMKLVPSTSGKGRTRLFYRGISIESKELNRQNRLTDQFKIAGFDIDINLMLGRAGDFLEINRDRLLPSAFNEIRDLLRDHFLAFFITILRILSGYDAEESASRQTLIELIDEADKNSTEIWAEFALFRYLHKADLCFDDKRSINQLDILFREKLPNGINAIYFSQDTEKIIFDWFPFKDIFKCKKMFFSDFPVQVREMHNLEVRPREKAINSSGKKATDTTDEAENDVSDETTTDTSDEEEKSTSDERTNDTSETEYLALFNSFSSKITIPNYSSIIAFELINSRRIIKLYQISDMDSASQYEDFPIIDNYSFMLIAKSQILDALTHKREGKVFASYRPFFPAIEGYSNILVRKAPLGAEENDLLYYKNWLVMPFCLSSFSEDALDSNTISEAVITVKYDPGEFYKSKQYEEYRQFLLKVWASENSIKANCYEEKKKTKMTQIDDDVKKFIDFLFKINVIKPVSK